MISSGAEAADRKQRIRDRYKGVDTSELEVIPAKTVEGLGESTSIRRVAAWKDHNLPQHVGSIRLANPLSLSVQPRGKTGSCAELYG